MPKGVLVTRPVPLGELLCQRIREKGHFAYPLATLAFEVVPFSKDLPAGHRLAEPLLLVITSQHALEYTPAALISELRTLFSEKKLQIVAIGNATAQSVLARHLGVHLIAPKGADSEWLLSQPLFKEVRGRACVILTGQQGRGILASSLVQRGAEVDIFEVYRRVCPSPSPQDWQLLQASIQIVVSSSFQSMVNLFTLVPKEFHAWLYDCTWIVPSERVQTLAMKQFSLPLAQIYISMGAGNEAVLEILQSIDPI